MLIGELSKRSQFSRDTIRYYEKLGLIHIGTERRNDSNYKNYPPEVLNRLRHIHILKECGFTLREIQRLLVNDGKYHVCDSLPSQLAGKISAIEKKVAELLEFKESLFKIQQACNSRCDTSNGMPDCVDTGHGKKKTSPCC